MLRTLILTVMIISVGSAACLAQPQTLGNNAALKYWLAFAQLPKLTETEERAIYANCATMPLDEGTRQLVGKSEKTLRLMRRGTVIRDCAWGEGYEDGIETLIPYAHATRVTCGLCCLRARMEFEEGEYAQGIDDIIAAMMLARHITVDGSLITVFLGSSIEQRLHEVLATYLPKFDAQTVKMLSIRMATLPPPDSAAKAMMTNEKSSMDWLIRRVRAEKDLQSLQKFFVAFLDTPKPQNGETFLKECGGTADGVVRFAEVTRDAYDTAARLLSMPLKEFDEAWGRERKKQEGNPVFFHLFVDLRKVRMNQAKYDIVRALWETALAVQTDGTEALRQHLDPVTGGPFEMITFPGGFELRSRWQPDEKPLTLTVGKRDK